MINRGQVMAIQALQNSVDVELISEGFKYVVQVIKTGPTSYFMIMNNSSISIEAHR